MKRKFFPREQHPVTTNLLQQQARSVCMFVKISAPERTDSQSDKATAVSTENVYPREEHPVTAILLQQQAKSVCIFIKTNFLKSSDILGIQIFKNFVRHAF
ncbi:hypothetical protein FF38_11460 [Lucilia cuprina]|uniref:Uncharacterized protein n=1 Tax=Lucilia cuprina TaxID=7375 RepID=A0A0L0BP93_LUCCU|nr:hypothetical protein FF38_11460 [Lucilia cuprina]